MEEKQQDNKINTLCSTEAQSIGLYKTARTSFFLKPY